MIRKQQSFLFLATFTFTGEQDGYSVPDATTATKTDTPLRDIPQSIQVIPRQLLEDRQVTRVQQITDNVPGVQEDVPAGGAPGANFIIRGFGSPTNYRDGFRGSGDTDLFDVAGIERIEILKGSASVLFGQNDPGGIVNIVSKQPLTQPYYSSTLTIGSFDFYRPTVDISGPLNSQKTKRCRTRHHARRLCDLQREEHSIETELQQLLNDSKFTAYREVFKTFGFGLRLEAIILSQIYPLEAYFGADGKPEVRIRKGRKSGKPTKRYLSLRRFQKSLGLAPSMDASGDKSKIKIVGDSDLCRIAFWQWVFTRIEVKRCRLNNEIGAALGAQLDAEKAAGRPIRLVRSRCLCQSCKVTISGTS
ncbi:IS110 family transposase [Tolypothrix sp. VBCCA 56010]|uniref:IS110 family transposase n=1 Tax=Tolypothrix sp. VBCCA 56010 TaxID=3137731 RepID=UPI003D7E2B76